MAKQALHVLLAQPRGFCAGVVRAVDIVERALAVYGPPVYVRHEIVHNKHVVDSLREKGARFVEDIEDIPEGAITVFSAHGVSRKVADDAGGRSLRVIDATCPLVSKVHNETRRYARRGYEIVLIGHHGHPEVEGTMGQVSGVVHLVSNVADVAMLTPADSAGLSYVTQTTLSVDDTREIIAALEARFPDIRGPDVKDICYATQNRQSAVRRLADRCEVILVIGADYSSNSKRLQEIGEEAGIDSYLIPDAESLDPGWLHGARTVGITAGASAPEELVQALIDRLGEMFDISVTDVDGIEENVTFRLPRELLVAEEQSANASARGRQSG
ncbi:MAG: 4-hydroxy-3-methylbut-2-enyl diphosphate reductase [Gammaproteobacteria bacterium]|nr:4-hydroxy-3-methylbut-2-enyl diphosphate reductase [Gammaproteobacteria bacterium]